MSPAMQHAAPPHASMYPGSPVLMHAPGIHGQSYMSPIPAGRGQLRNDPPSHLPMQHAPSGTIHRHILGIHLFHQLHSHDQTGKGEFTFLTVHTVYDDSETFSSIPCCLLHEY